MARTPPQISEVRPPSAFTQHLYWLMPFGLFLIVRLFSGDPFYLLAGDQCTFLEMGRTFPKHQLFNHELYLIHPPFFGYAIGVFQLVLPLLISGLAATLLFACLTFFLIRELGRFEGFPPAAIFAGLLYLALSRPAVAYDYHVARVSFLVCGTAFAILAFLRLLRDPSRENLILSAVANVVCLLISDQALLLLPCQAVLLFSRGAIRGTRWIPLAVASALAAMFWPAVRLVEFWRRSDLPAGIDGTIEFTRNFPFLAVLQPNFLPFTNAHRSLFTQTSLSLGNLKPSLLAALPADVLIVPSFAGAAIVLILIAAAIIQPESRWRSIQWLVLSLIFLLPVGLGMNEWYGMSYIVPFTMLMMEGAGACMTRIGWSAQHWERSLIIVPTVICGLAAVLWLEAPVPEPHGLLLPRGGTHFLFARPAITRGASAASFFTSMPSDTGIMAPQGLSPEIVYLTGKRVTAIPFDPALLDRFIAEYHISYLLLSNEYLEQYDSRVANRYTGHEVARFIVDHPERYRPVKALREEYPAFYPPIEYAIFQTN